MPGSLQSLCKTPGLLQRVKKKKERKDMKRKENSNGWTETPFFPGDTHLGLLGRGFVSLLPAPPPFLPQGLLLQGS